MFKTYYHNLSYSNVTNQKRKATSSSCRWIFLAIYRYIVHLNDWQLNFILLRIYHRNGHFENSSRMFVWKLSQNMPPPHPFIEIMQLQVFNYPSVFKQDVETGWKQLYKQSWKISSNSDWHCDSWWCLRLSYLLVF